MALGSLPIEQIRKARQYLWLVLVSDAIALRPNRPRVRAPITDQTQSVFRVMLFDFFNVKTGLCNPSICTIARKVGCDETSVKRHLKALKNAGFLDWTHGEPKRIKTASGWRMVRGSNHYKFFCPERHFEAFLRYLNKAFRGNFSAQIRAAVQRFTAPKEAANTCAEVVKSVAANLRPNASRTTNSPGHDPPPTPPRPSAQADGLREVGGIKVFDPTGSLARLWEALEQQGN